MTTPRPAYVTTMTDEQWASEPVQERALHVLRGLDELHVQAIGNQAGTWVGRFLASVGLPTGYNWCAACLYYCLLTAGANPKKLPAKREAAGVINWRAWAIAQGRMTAFGKRGRAFFWLDGGHGHIGDIRGVEGTTYATIEANTSIPKSKETGIADKTRTLIELARHELHGFIDLGGLQ